ncbi:MAG: DUF177 domain-containing protein [Alphaproteobacteria bacterium]|nr:DUF177 domain-containing protein [Alphaproteobacteria bacterium]
MNNPATPEFSRLVPLERVGAEPYRQRIEANPQERERLAQRFDLLALDFFAADVELHRQNGKTVFLNAAFHAEFEQCCGATLEPVRGEISDRFSLVYGPAEEEEQDITVSEDEPAFEPLAGDAIDIAEAVAQELSLALPEFPRDPNAAIDDLLPAEPIEGPFTSLGRLRKRSEC